MKLLMLMAGCLATGCGDTATKQSGESTSEVSDAAEPWVSKPHSEWPQIVLTNRAEFNGHSSLRGASAFLIEGSHETTLAGTARHLIGEAGGVDPPIDINELAKSIDKWKLFPRTLPDKFVEAKYSAVPGLHDPKLDWLILAVQPTQELPATPLKGRASPIKVGEKVFLVGCPYSEPACKQNVYSGVVRDRVANMFRYDLNPPVNLRGFSGAPILDESGHLVGVMTVWFARRLSDDNDLEGGGEDFAPVMSLLIQAKKMKGSESDG